MNSKLLSKTLILVVLLMALFLGSNAHQDLEAELLKAKKNSENAMSLLANVYAESEKKHALLSKENENLQAQIELLNDQVTELKRIISIYEQESIQNNYDEPVQPTEEPTEVEIDGDEISSSEPIETETQGQNQYQDLKVEEAQNTANSDDQDKESILGSLIDEKANKYLDKAKDVYKTYGTVLGNAINKLTEVAKSTAQETISVVAETTKNMDWNKPANYAKSTYGDLSELANSLYKSVTCSEAENDKIVNKAYKEMSPNAKEAYDEISREANTTDVEHFKMLASNLFQAVRDQTRDIDTQKYIYYARILRNIAKKGKEVSKFANPWNYVDFAICMASNNQSASGCLDEILH